MLLKAINKSPFPFLQLKFTPKHYIVCFWYFLSPLLLLPHLLAFRFLFLLLMLFVFNNSLHASCGLHSCPPSESQSTHPFEFGLKNNTAQFDLLHAQGLYTLTTPYIQYTNSYSWMFKASLSHASLFISNEHHAAIKNFLLQAQKQFNINSKVKTLIGFQTELPSPQNRVGITQNHFMFLPFTGFIYVPSQIYLSLITGFNSTLNSHSHSSSISPPPNTQHSHQASHLMYVSPHEDHELLYRLTGGYGTMPNLPYLTSARCEIFLSGQRPFVHKLESVTNTHDLSAGILALLLFKERFVISPSFEYPLIPQGRFSWSTEISMGFRFGSNE